MCFIVNDRYLSRKQFLANNKDDLLMNKKAIILISTLIISIVLFSQITIFTIQPIGALPEGKTLIILRLNKTKFIDSADAICEREMGSVNLFCRAAMMGAVAEKSTILLKLPYSEFLYTLSTNGKKYEK